MRPWIRCAVFSAALGCARELTVPSKAIEEPRFLGAYSGLYEPFDQTITGEAGTLVVQLGDRMLVAPYDVEDGTPRLEIFATAIRLEDAGDGTYTYTDTSGVQIDVTEIYGAGARCSATAAAPTTLDEFFAIPAACGAGCIAPCWLSSPLMLTDGIQPGDGISGECQPDGVTCIFPHGTFGGRLAPEGLDLYFPQTYLLPPGRKFFACEPGTPWERCFRYEKTCSFDPRLAGVYRLNLEYDASQSDVAGVDRELEVAVAADHNLAAAAVFDGECAFFGSPQRMATASLRSPAVITVDIFAPTRRTTSSLACFRAATYCARTSD